MPSLLINQEPLDALCRHFNVAKTSYHEGPLGERFEMTLTSLSANLYPTHVLAVTHTNAPPNSPRLMLPVDSGLYARGFDPDLAWPSDDPPEETPMGTATDDASAPVSTDGDISLSLPVVQLTVPDLTSLPLLLLFGLGLETDTNLLPWRLLPSQVVEEFPAPAAMAQIFARFREEHFERFHMYIHGIWKNILALGLKNNQVVEIVSTAWSVASEARRIRQRAAATQDRKSVV